MKIYCVSFRPFRRVLLNSLSFLRKISCLLKMDNTSTYRIQYTNIISYYTTKYQDVENVLQNTQGSHHQEKLEQIKKGQNSRTEVREIEMQTKGIIKLRNMKVLSFTFVGKFNEMIVFLQVFTFSLNISHNPLPHISSTIFSQ